MRPWRYPGLETSQCRLKNENLKIILPTNSSFTMEVDDANIQVLSDNKIYRITLTSKVMPFTLAAQEVDRISQALGIDATNFDKYMADFGKRPVKQAISGLGTIIGGIYIQILFQGPIVDAPARVLVLLTWTPPNEITKPHLGPIQPPPGYENVSMDPPPNPSYIKPDPNFPNYYQKPAQNSPSVLASSNPAANSSIASNPAVKPSPTQASVPAPPSAAPFVAYRWLLALLVLVLGVWWLVRRK